MDAPLAPEFTEAIQSLTQQVKIAKPSNLFQFCADFFLEKMKAASVAPDANKPRQFHTDESRVFGRFSFAGKDMDNESQLDCVLKQDDKAGSSDPAATKNPSSSTNKNLPDTSKPAAFQVPVNFNPLRRTSVSAESMNPTIPQNLSQLDLEKPKLDPSKFSPPQLERLNKFIDETFIFRHLDEESRLHVLSALVEKKVSKGTTIITEGDEGDYFYYVESGQVEFYKGNETISSPASSTSFGELALMYNAARAATVKAATDCVLLVLDRVTFRRILLDRMAHKRIMYEEFLKEVPILKDLNHYERSKLADALSSRTYEKGQVIIHEGDEGEDFFLVESGTADVSKTDHGKVQELRKGDYFGEVALLHNSVRRATVTATSKLRVVALDRAAFQRLLGPAVDILKRQDPTDLAK